MEIGKVVNTFGLKGEIKVFPYIDYLDNINKIYINKEKMEIEKIRFQKNIAIIKIKGKDDINEIEQYKGKTIEINEEDKPILPDGTYYIEDLIGIDVITDDGKNLGKLDKVLTNTANDVYQIGEILLPATKEVIKKIDLENKQMIVHLLKGLI